MSVALILALHLVFAQAVPTTQATPPPASQVQTPGVLRVVRPIVATDKPGDPEQKPDQVTVRASPPPRSASDAQVDRDTIRSIPHETGADVLGTLPGVYVSNRGLLGQAPRLSIRGFEGASGQDVELWVGSVPMNQISNLRAPGYADMRLVIPEVVHDVRITHGPYDPHQGDAAIAGSVHMELGTEEPGFLAEGTAGSFGTRRAGPRLRAGGRAVARVVRGLRGIRDRRAGHGPRRTARRSSASSRS